MTQQISVTKRSGEREALDLDKIHRVLEWATEGLTGVSISEIELRANIQLYDGIPAYDIHQLLIKSAAELISEDFPNYQYVAARLANYKLRKDVYGQYEPTRLYELVKRNVAIGVYDPGLLEIYSEADFDQAEGFLKHDRDYQFAYAGMEQLLSKYLVRDRRNKSVYYETPQILYLMVGMALFSVEDPGDRMAWIKRFYDGASTFMFSLPTPIMAGCRTPVKQFSSCVLIDSGDSLDSINETAASIVKYASKKAGIGLNGGRIRAQGSKVGDGSVIHTGVVPFYKYWRGALKSCSQGGVRGASATLNFPWWHREVQDMIVLKNNKGTEETRIRDMDYCIHLNGFFYDAVKRDEVLYLFSPHDAPDLYDAFYKDQEEFARLYEINKAFADEGRLEVKKTRARELFADILRERQETGRLYIFHADHVNEHSPFKPEVAPIYMTNLCCVVKGTQIATRLNGGEPQYRAIETLEEFLQEDELEVWGHAEGSAPGSGQWTKVIAWARTKRAQELIRLESKVSGWAPLYTTPEHKIWTERGWVEARDVTDDDIILMERGFSTVTTRSISADEWVYDIQTETSNFFANGILIHNCEITLPTSPLNGDGGGEIALCTLAGVNWGKVNKPEDFKEPARILVRALDNLLTYQDYPLLAAHGGAQNRRSLGIGIISLAHFLAKRGLTYGPDAYETVHEYAEAWSYYLIEASVDLAFERGGCEWGSDTRYVAGILPIDTYCRAVDELVEPVYKQNWACLREWVKKVGIRNSTLMALMPAETSAQVINEWNGIEPAASLVTSKGSKDGTFAQVVPDISRLKNKYHLRWDQSPAEYIKLMAIIQKFVDQSGSFNTSHNPNHYPGGQIPMSQLMADVLLAHRYGLKTLYYANPYAEKEDEIHSLADLKAPEVIDVVVDEACEACVL